MPKFQEQPYGTKKNLSLFTIKIEISERWTLFKGKTFV